MAVTCCTGCSQLCMLRWCGEMLGMRRHRFPSLWFYPTCSQNTQFLLLLPGPRVSLPQFYCCLRGSNLWGEGEGRGWKRQNRRLQSSNRKENALLLPAVVVFLTLLFPPSVLWLLCSLEKTNFVGRAAFINESKQPLLCYCLYDALIMFCKHNSCYAGRSLVTGRWESSDDLWRLLGFW